MHGKQRRNLSRYGGFFDYDGKKAALEEIEETIVGNPDFWNDPKLSGPTLKKKKILESTLTRADALRRNHEDLQAALELIDQGGEEYLGEAETLVEELENELSALETQSLLGDELDLNDAVVTINAGAGGTESCDWAAMLLRMYLRYAERHGWQTEIYDELAGDEAGVKNVSFGVSGEYAFGMLKAESGVHRLVRISPFDSNARRHTSFASVYVSPVIDENIEVDIVDSDLRIDTYRASGAGGQHVNRTDSAVRITHLPTGIVVQCQSQRSQHQNKDKALRLLKSRLYERALEEKKQKQQAQEDAKSDIGWGSQIRSYVLHPYKMVKDHRTNLENHNPEAVLDGELDEFIAEYLSAKQLKKL